MVRLAGLYLALVLLAGLCECHKYFQQSIVDEYYMPLFKDQLVFKEKEWKHNYFAVLAAKALNAPLATIKSQAAKELKGFSTTKLTDYFFASEVARALDLPVPDASSFTQKCGDIMTQGKDVEMMSVCAKSVLRRAPNLTKTAFPDAAYRRAHIIDGLTLATELSAAGVKAIDKPKLISTLLGASMSLEANTLQLKPAEESSLVATCKALLGLTALPANERVDYEWAIQKMGVYVLQSVYSVQTLEELYYYLSAVSALKEFPLVIEVKNAAKIASGAEASVKFTCNNVFGETRTVSDKAKLTVRNSAGQTLPVSLSKAPGNEYVAKFGPVKEPLKWAQATLNVEYVAGAIMSEPLPLSYSASFSSLQYRLGAKASDPEYKKLAFPNTMETLKIVSSAVRAEFRLEFDVAGVAPNNTYLLLQHKTHPSVSATVHFDPARRHTVLDFSNTEFIKNMNGEYKVSLISEGAGLAAKSLVWDLGSILVDLPSGTTDYVEPVTRGPLKFKEIRHIFAPELVYAPGVVAYAVAGFIVVLLLVFFFSICGLKTGMSNVPASFSGKLYAAVFVILMIALFALLVYFWFFMRLLDLLPILCVFAALLIYFGHKTLNSVGDIVIIQADEERSEERTGEEKKPEPKTGKSKSGKKSKQ